MQENKRYSNSKTIIFGLIGAALIIAGGAWLDKLSREASAPSSSNEQQARIMNYISYQGEEGKNALDLLKAKHSVETQTFQGAGEFVTSINGLKGNSSNFWAFYVNNEQANVGASQYTTKSADFIEWKYEEIKPQDATPSEPATPAN
jgi:hypothetical protein